MFKFVLSVLSVFAVTTAFAQDSLESISLDNPKVADQGFRIGFVRSFLNETVNVSGYDNNFAPIIGSDTFSAPHYGFDASYVYAPIDRVGFVVGGAYLVNEKIPGAYILRTEMGIASAISNRISAKMAANIAYISNANRSFGLGYTAGLGIKLNPVFMAQLNYVSMSSGNFIANDENSIQAQGFEAQLLATF